MKHCVISITRQFASMGLAIANNLSEQLEIPLCDEEIAQKVAKRSNIDLATINHFENNSKYYPLGMGSQLQDQIFEIQKKVILDLAESQSCIFVGRLSDFILTSHPNHMSIYIYAPYEARLKNCVDKLGMTVKQAQKTIESVDSARELYRKTYTKQGKDMFTNRQMMLDSSFFGIEGTANLISEYVKNNML